MSNKQIVMLNEVSDGYYIHKSELDIEEKYNQAVDVFKILPMPLSSIDYFTLCLIVVWRIRGLRILH